jgi:hypothetical protein
MLKEEITTLHMQYVTEVNTQQITEPYLVDFLGFR